VGRIVKLVKALLCATALVSTCSALAAGPSTNKAPPAAAAQPAAYSWTGFYLGAGVGGGWMQAKDRSYSTFSTSGGPSVAMNNKSDLGKFGAFGTIKAGADDQLGRFVVGAFTDFDFESLTKTKSVDKNGVYSFHSVLAAYAARHNVGYKVGDSWDAGVRLGYLLNDRNLLYALGGYSGAQVSSGVRLSVNYGSGTANSAVASESGWKSGYMVGAGWEDALTDHITFKLEYRYADYGKATSSYATNSGSGRQSGDVSVQSVRAVLGYKF